MSHKRASRCRNYNDDGKPIGRGCARENCPFLHSNDPAWAQASRRRNSDVNSNQSGPSHLPGNSGWGSRSGPPSGKTSSKDWDSSLWDSPSKKTDDNRSTKNWNSQSSAKRDGTAASPTSSVSNDWNMTTDKGEPSKSGTEGGWGGTGGWGADNTDNTASVGWGEGWGGNVSDELGAWGGGKTGDNTSTSGNDQKGKTKEREGEDVEMRNPSPPRTVGSLKHTSLSGTKSESAPLPPARNTPPPSTVASKPTRPIPLPLPSKQKRALFEDGNLTKLALQTAKNKEAEQVQEKPNSLSVRGPKGRANLYSQVLKHTSTVTVLQVELQRAQRDLTRWKRTQESAQYERASHATRAILDQNRAIFNLRVQEARRRLERALTTLVDLPDFASQNRKNPSPILTKQTIEAYTAELRDWFSDVELHKRILMEKEKEEAAAQTDLPAAPVEQLTAQQLIERGKWSWNEIKMATNELNTRILSTAEHLYSDVYTTIADLKDQVVGFQDPCPLNLSTTTTTTKGNHQFDALSSTANLVGDNLSVQANRAAELISKIHALEQEHELLKDETRAMNKICAEAAEVYFPQFEQWRQNDVAKIQELTERLRTTHLHKPPKVPPAQLDSIVVQLRPVIIDNVEKQLQPILDALRNQCLENLEGMKDLIEKHVTPALVMTDDICHRVSNLSCDEIS